MKTTKTKVFDVNWMRSSMAAPDPTKQWNRRGFLRLTGVGMVGAAVTVWPNALAADSARDPELLPGDAALHGEILEARGGLAHAAARWLDYGGKWVVLAPAMVALFAWSRAVRRHWWLWCALMPVGGAFEQLFKFLVGRPRPRGFHWGFPSGHVTAATTFAVLLLYAQSREPASARVRVSLIVLAALLVGTVGFARVILNAHWPSDVLGGVLLGGGCAPAGAWWDSLHGETPRPVDGAVRVQG